MSPAKQRLLSIASLSAILYACGALVEPHVAYAESPSLRPLEHDDYDVWNTITRWGISNDGAWIMYSVQSGAIDGEQTLHIHNSKTSQEYLIERGGSAQFSYDSRFAVFRVTPPKKLDKNTGERRKRSGDIDGPKLQILELSSGEASTIENVRSFRMPEENGEWVACQLNEESIDDELSPVKTGTRETYEVTPNGLRRPQKPIQLKSREQLLRERGLIEKEEEKAKPAAKKKTKPNEGSSGLKNREQEPTGDSKDKDIGTSLVLVNLHTKLRRIVPFVDSFVFAKNGERIALATSVKAAEKNPSSTIKKDQPLDSIDGSGFDRPLDGVHLIDLKSLKQTTILQGTGEYRNLTFNEDGSQLALISNKDDYGSKTPSWTVYRWRSNAKTAEPIASEESKGIPEGWWIAPGSGQRFSEDGRRLYFDTAPIPDSVLKERQTAAKDPKTKSDADDRKPKLDIWHWQDPLLQPQQLLQAEIERNRDYRAAFVFRSKKIIQLATRQIPSVSIDYRSKSDLAIARTNYRYRKMLSWDIPGYQDVYLVDLNTGEQKLILEKVKYNVSASPNGKYIWWFDSEQEAWFAKATNDEKAKPTRISRGINYPLYDELHDTPNLPRAYGSAGWLDDDAALLVYDRFDIWSLNPTGQTKPVCITSEFGRANSIRLRYSRLDREQRSVDPAAPMILEAFNQKTKASGFYRLPPIEADNKTHDNKDSVPEKLIMLDESLKGLQKAKHSETVVFTRSTFRMYPDLWTSTIQFKKIHRVSDSNPQQKNYSWGSAELVSWKADDGRPLDGILLKPDDFDTNKKYPMLVYFYERNSDNLHSYYPPAAGRSIICHSFYVSRGYLVFIPDIPYKAGQPGPSAANAILPGVRHLIDKGFVDQARIGTQGHSWGGYQTAYLVTQTDMFACAESGAPVSNMTSAYGGIRWGSGMSRMFQYERTQSRIGDDLWSARENT